MCLSPKLFYSVLVTLTVILFIKHQDRSLKERVKPEHKEGHDQFCYFFYLWRFNISMVSCASIFVGIKCFTKYKSIYCRFCIVNSLFIKSYTNGTRSHHLNNECYSVKLLRSNLFLSSSVDTYDELDKSLKSVFTRWIQIPQEE